LKPDGKMIESYSDGRHSAVLHTLPFSHLTSGYLVMCF